MGIHDIFKHFWGIGPDRIPPDNRETMPPLHEDDASVPSDDFHSQPFNFVPPGFGQMFQQFDQMMKDIEHAFGNLEDLPNQPTVPHGHGFTFSFPGHDQQKPGGLRDHMLKEPDIGEGPTHDNPLQPKQHEPGLAFSKHQPDSMLRDSDLDDEVREKGLGPVLRQLNPENPERSPAPRSLNHFSSVVVTTTRTPDGKIEQRRTVRDGSGREETTVTRTIDDQTHSVITTKKPDGEETVVENFKNMDENSADQFEKRWRFRFI